MMKIFWRQIWMIRFNYSIILLSTLAAEMEFYNKVTIRQKEDKGVKEEITSIFMESEIASEGEVQEKDSSEEVVETEVSIKFEFNKQNDYVTGFIKDFILNN
jgi:predicted transposase YbfD/YdcC